MKPYDILAVGELNVDIILNNIDGLPEIGKEKFAQSMVVTLGSSTAIFAANAAAFGAKVGFVGMVGRDSFGALVKEQLQSKGVDTSLLIESREHATGATIVLSYSEDRANVTYQGAMDAMGIADIDLSVFDKTKHIHISSIFMQSGLKRDLLKVLQLAKQRGVTTSLDLQWDPAEKWNFDYQVILPYVTVFLPNEKELMLITGSLSLEEAIGKVAPYINHAVVKMGNKGSLLLEKGKSPAMLGAFLNTKVVDAIGAGDSFNAGFISQLVKGSSLVECQRVGNLGGAINTTHAGGTGAFSNKEQIAELAQRIFSQTIHL